MEQLARDWLEGEAFQGSHSMHTASLRGCFKKAGLSRKMSPMDLLLQYSKVYHVEIGDRDLV
ncbi:MAG: hypothetical protein A4E44_01890 [Methanosaeta sp. PtaB.Bin018]|jgi:hypothetical protein|nr:MAG: hypothetical protein A4E44_01890 [Methanosaeta sp. PtaB.Bin018]OPY47626.1 MAG: hypothetical protein A4E46_00340 [Methanosaeta sp. PtaU1.Bin016]